VWIKSFGTDSHAINNLSISDNIGKTIGLMSAINLAVYSMDMGSWLSETNIKKSYFSKILI
jgi:hypothetical protein